MLDEIFMQVLDMTKVASVVILVVVLARLLLKKVPKVYSYGLWAVVLFRLLCPETFETPVSIVPRVSPTVQNYSLVDEPISIVGAGEAAYRAVGDAANGGLGIQHIRTTETDAGGMAKWVHTDWWEVWLLFGQYVWVAGMVVMLLYSMVSYFRLRKKLVVIRPLDAASDGRHRGVGGNIFVADDIESPFVIGFFRPRIYLPCGLTGKEQEYIILHEEYHIRRRDPIVKLLAFGALSIHWFNPLVWAAFTLANRDMEMSCDEAVVRKMGEDVRADYSTSLLALATGKRIIAGTPLAFGEGDTKGRIKNLANLRKPVLWVSVAAVVGCSVLAVCLLTNQASKNTTLLGAEYFVRETLYHTSEEYDFVTTPTTAHIRGAFDAYLYVPLDGETYRFERTSMDVTRVTPGEFLDRFTEEAAPENVDWKVYAVKEYPKHNVVLAVAGTDYECLYQYSPSKRTDRDALQQAKESGCVIMEDGDVTSGQQMWQDFVKETEEGKRASVQLAHYYTLDEEKCDERYYEAYQEDYPALYVQELTYDGDWYTLQWKDGETEYVRKYRYLMRYEGEAPTAKASFDTYVRYVLTQDDTVTWEQLSWGLVSSQLGDYIDHYQVYADSE